MVFTMPSTLSLLLYPTGSAFSRYHTIQSPLILLLPSLFLSHPNLELIICITFLQCIRRLCEEKESVHGYNALKYMLTIIAVIIRTAYELKKGRTWMNLALVSSGVATGMNTFWDIVIDWGLLRRHSQNPYLRDKLLVPHKSVYFAAMVSSNITTSENECHVIKILVK